MSSTKESSQSEGPSLSQSDTVTACMGRFIISLPTGMVFSYGDTRMAGWQISSISEETEEMFKARIAKREIELSAKENARGLASLETNRNVQFPEYFGRIFSYDRTWDYHLEGKRRVDHEWFSVEAFIRRNSISFHFFKQIAKPMDLTEIESLVSNTQTRKSLEIPSQAGFCIEDGFIVDPVFAEIRAESSVVFAGFPSRPDVAVALSSMSGAIVTTTLLQRTANTDIRRMYPNAFRTIFTGARDINGIFGEESSESVKELNGTRAHSYMRESQPVGKEVMHPFLILELTTGNGRPGEPVNSSLSDKEVQALWDQISGSLRHRPVKTPVPATAPEKTRSDHSDAGTPCPASGWWSCAEQAESYQVVGGTSQYFAAGVRMPQAELYGPSNFFGRRTTFTLSTPTRWKLVKEQS